MYFQYERRYSLLTVADDFAHLRKVRRNGDMIFDLFYTVNPHDAVSHNAMTVNVTVFSRSIKRKPLLENSHRGVIDTRSLIKNILTQMPDAKSAIKQQDEYNVVIKSSDVSAKVNNEIIGQLKAKVPGSAIPQLAKSVLKLVPSSEAKEATEVKPILTLTAHAATTDVYAINSASIDDNPTRLMHDMIARQGIDPSFIVNLDHRSVPAADSVGGTLRSTRTREPANSPASRLLHCHLFPPEAQQRTLLTSDLQDSQMVQVLTSEPQTSVEIPVTVVIPRHSLTFEGRDNAHFFVKFELVNGSNGVAIDSVTRSLDVARHSQLFYTPRKAPIVKVTRSEISTRVNLEIKQIDAGATRVAIFRKVLFRASTNVDDYVLIGTYNVKANQQSLLVQVDMPRNSAALYRVIPVGLHGTRGFEFTNVVVKPSRYRPIKAVALVAYPIDVGVRLEARHIPQHVVAIEFKVRNASIHESEYTNVAGDVFLIDDTVRTSDYITVVDRNVSPNNIYEYVVRLIYASGTSELAGSAIIEFLAPEPGKVDTRIENIAVTQGAEPNVTFTMTSDIIDSNIDIVKALVQQQGIYDQFKDDVTREREFLKNLIAHNVQRVDLTTGGRDNFGVITTPSFSDVDLRKKQAIGALQIGHRYRYEVTALLRAPETMFESLSKEKVDNVTKKNYTFNPAKFLHPHTLKRGMIVSAAGLKTRFAKEAMSHGTIGTTEVAEISLDSVLPSVLDASASRFDKYLNVITWRVEGSIDDIDHFIIMKDVHGVRTLIGKTHSEFLNGNCQYLHPVGRRDVGALIYIIVPIYNNYRTGTSAKTNTVIVESVPDISRLVANDQIA